MRVAHADGVVVDLSRQDGRLNVEVDEAGVLCCDGPSLVRAQVLAGALDWIGVFAQEHVVLLRVVDSVVAGESGLGHLSFLGAYLPRRMGCRTSCYGSHYTDRGTDVNTENVTSVTKPDLRSPHTPRARRCSSTAAAAARAGCPPRAASIA